MAYKDINDLERGNGETGETTETLKLQIMDEVVELPNDSFIRDADLSRENMDLILESPEGTIIIEDYFSGFESPALTAPSGASLSPQLVNSFISSGNEYAANETASDVSPVGAVQEISGEATITRLDGSTHKLSIGSPVYQGDVVETDAGSAVNIAFVDESSFAVSEDTRLAIDEYVFDPVSQGGSQNFSVLKGVFVYTSGLIGREDPDDVTIDTPVGSIGIRGTIIAGDVNEGEITVVEGAIVLRNPAGEELTLANQFETGKFMPDNRGIANIGQKAANDVIQKFSIVSGVAPGLFSSINDAAAEDGTKPPPAEGNQDDPTLGEPVGPRDGQPEFNADGTTDQNNDGQVDGTVDDGTTGETGEGEEAMTLEGEEKALEGEPVEDQADQMDPTMVQIAESMGMLDGTYKSMTTMGGMEQTMAMTVGSEDGTLYDGTAMDMLKQSMEANMDGTMDGKSDMMVHTDDPNIIYFMPKAGPARPISFKWNGVTLDDRSLAPTEYFASGEDTVWSYHFDKEFGGNIDHFELSLETKVKLNSLFADGILVSGAEMANGWSFDGSLSGHALLTLNFATDFSAAGGSSISAGAFDDFYIHIGAFNSAGEINFGGFQDYQFKMFNDDTTPSGSWASGGLTGSNIVASSPGSTATSTFALFSLTGSDVFFGEGNDTDIQIGNSGTASDNYIYLGNGDNAAKIWGGSTSTENVIFGGDQKDKLIVEEFKNTFHGMDGDDTIEIDASYLAGQSNTLTDTLYDGGWSGFSAKAAIDPNYHDTSGHGDLLKLTGSGSALDFSNISQYFKGIERLSLSGTGVSATLSLNDVLNMTDNKQTLLIRADAGDTVNISDGGFTLQEDNVPINDDGAGNNNFDVYRNAEGVTLIIEDASNTTGGSGTNISVA